MRNQWTRFSKWLATRFRNWANYLDPPVQTEADKLYPLALELVTSAPILGIRAGSIRHLMVMKIMERQTGASRLDINEAIERAVRTHRQNGTK
jgi:hypothetical protein